MIVLLNGDIECLKKQASSAPFHPAAPHAVHEPNHIICNAALLPLPSDLHQNHPLSPEGGTYFRSSQPTFPSFITFGNKTRHKPSSEQTKFQNKITIDDIEIIGDSLIRDQGPIMHKKCTGNSIRSTSYPSGKIDTISHYISNTAYNPKFSVICVGSNDIKDTSFDDLKSKYNNLFTSLKIKRRNTLVLGILPRQNETSEWKIKTRELNTWIRTRCSSESLSFLDLWDIFSPETSLFARDQIHLNHKGKNLLSDIILQHLTLPNFLD